MEKGEGGTANVVESPFAAVRLRTDAAKRYKGVPNAMALIWKVLMVAQSLSGWWDIEEGIHPANPGQLST